MATDFKYVPLQPEPISGQSALEQTEMAINELGGQIEESSNLAQDALDMANSANTTANEALTEANAASTAAQSAQTTADTAMSTAQSAQANASQALTTANQALDASAIAEGDSGNALTTATQALTTANAAQATATTADQNASSAVSVAQAASITSGIAMGIFQVDSDAVDANMEYTGAKKLFLTNTGNTNFPVDIETPFWLMVYINSDSTSVTHTCWDDVDTSRIYTRTATINNSDPNNPVVTWSPWQSVATPNNLESVDVQVDPAGQPAGTYLVFVYSTTSGNETLYINLSQLMPVYTPGNNAITISDDYKVSLKTDPSSSGISIGASGLSFNLPAHASTHASTGSDPLTPAQIGALSVNGTAVNTKYVSSENKTITTNAEWIDLVNSVPIGALYSFNGSVSAGVLTGNNVPPSVNCIYSIYRTGTARRSFACCISFIDSSSPTLYGSEAANYGSSGWNYTGINPRTSIKAYAYVNKDGSVVSSYNVTSVTRQSLGRFTVNSPIISLQSAVLCSANQVSAANILVTEAGARDYGSVSIRAQSLDGSEESGFSIIII